MKTSRIAKDIAGLLTLVTLLGMMVAQFIYQDLSISNTSYTILLVLISAFMGIDIIWERWDMILTALERIGQLIRQYLNLYRDIKDDDG